MKKMEQNMDSFTDVLCAIKGGILNELRFLHALNLYIKEEDK